MHDGWLAHLCMDRTVVRDVRFAVRPTRSILRVLAKKWSNLGFTLVGLMGRKGARQSGAS